MSQVTLANIEASEATKPHDIKTLQKLDRMLSELYVGSVSAATMDGIDLLLAPAGQLNINATDVEINVSVGDIVLNGNAADRAIVLTGYTVLTSPVAPATAASSGRAGEVRLASGFIYICTATDTWKRVAISTW